MIIKILLLCLQLFFWSQSFAAGSSGVELLDANVDIGRKNSLQRGAQTFFNYCSGCHSIQFMRYNRMASDIGLSEDVLKTNLMFASDKVGDNIKIAMDSEEAASWFGVSPPDLSVIARVRGEDWLYSFLNGFYVDPDRPTGVNNLFFPETAMPHVLWELQGYRTLEKTERLGSDSYAFKTIVEGKLTPSQYETLTRDLVSFLVYVGEPARLVRYQIGFWVIAFLILLFVFSYLTKREYWRDIH